MIGDFQPYTEQRVSQSEWLGTVPAHWETRRFKYLLTERTERSATGTEPLLRVSQFTGITKRATIGQSEAADTRAESLAGYKIVRQNDLVINIMLAWNGSLGVSKFETGIASPAYCVYRFRESLNPWYFHHLLRSSTFKSRIKSLSTGVVESRLRLYSDKLFSLDTLLPPPDEQELIVRFLDWASVKLGKAIAAKRKVIGLLEEQKQAIVHRAVTRGLDDTVSLKPSGLDWLGDVPEHWKIMRIKNLLSGIDYGTSENARGDGHIRVLNMGHIKSGRVRIPANGSLRAMPLGLELRSHDLLFNRTNSPELVGKVGIFLGTEADRVTFASYLVRLRPKADHNPFWLCYMLNSMGFWHYARRQAFVSLHQANLNSTRYSQMSIPVPPASEQQLIAEALRAETASFDNAISANEHEIELIREYRTRLIADVVTGKLDVRKFAQTLPADVAEEAAELTSSELGDDEFTDSDDELADELAGEPA